ncbi:exosortase K [Ohtaekwangia sp.]|uniref:exosortase K n=1 Tax=Ohtaekwangia sp. TaxID=2066019 RepID=UPI002FDCBD92
MNNKSYYLIPSFTMKTRLNKTALWVCITIITAIVLKILFNGIASGEMILFLNPTSTMLEYILNKHAQSTTSGFFFPDLHIMIDRSLSSENFLVMVFFVLSCTAPYHILKAWKAILLYGAILLASFVLTLAISAVRIMMALPVIRLQDSQPWLNSFWMQRVEGGVFYIIALLLVYLVFRNIFIHMKQQHDLQHPQASAVRHNLFVTYRRNSHLH